jgi:HSP20 family protein
MGFWDDWFRRRRRHFSPFFEDFDRFFEETMKRFFEDLPEDMFREEELEKGGKRKTFGPFVYGYSMSIGPDGKPRIQEFGNMKPSLTGGPETTREREPLVDVIEDEETIQVVAEVPGVEKEDIRLEVSADSMNIKVDSEPYKYAKTLDLPAEVDRYSAKAKYRNGVLEVTIQKKEKRPPSRKTITIE